jgi:hypothetical protein
MYCGISISRKNRIIEDCKQLIFEDLPRLCYVLVKLHKIYSGIHLDTILISPWY